MRRLFIYHQNKSKFSENYLTIVTFSANIISTKTSQKIRRKAMNNNGKIKQDLLNSIKEFTLMDDPFMTKVLKMT